MTVIIAPNTTPPASPPAIPCMPWVTSELVPLALPAVPLSANLR
jgi:hypothetical protein